MKNFNRRNVLYSLLILVFFGLGWLYAYLLFGRPSSPTAVVVAGLGENEVGATIPELGLNNSGIPLFSIITVEKDQSITIRTSNFPANQNFQVTMGAMFTQGIGGIVVGTINSGDGGTIIATFGIPSSLKGSGRISIRAQTSHAYPYYSYNWFYNKDGGVLPTLGPMLRYEWSEKIQYGRGGEIRVSFLNPDASRLIIEPTIDSQNQGTRTVTSNIPTSFGTPEAGLLDAFGPSYKPCARLYLTNPDFVIEHHKGENCFELDNVIIGTISPKNEHVRGPYNINISVESVWVPVENESGQKPIPESILESNIPIDVTNPPFLNFGGVDLSGWIFGTLSAVLSGIAITRIEKRISTRIKNDGILIPQPQHDPLILESPELVQLHFLIDKYFSEQELRTLCFNLGVDYDDLPFSGQSNKARELVSLYSRSNKHKELHEAIKKARPFLFKDNNEKEMLSDKQVSATNLPINSEEEEPV